MKTETPVLGKQCRTILKHLREEGSISAMEALVVHKIPRLAARICDLRDAGVKITSATKVDNLGARYTRYALLK